jgi:S-adenosyl methyltransferase
MCSGGISAPCSQVNNFSSDRDMGGRMAEVNPSLPQWVRHNREFICAAAARAAAAGISQFLDLGSGLPAHPAVHEAVRAVIPDARVCYVDIDPVAVIHGEALLARGYGLAAVRADLTEPATVLADPRVRAVIDISEPGRPGLMADRVFRALRGQGARRPAVRACRRRRQIPVTAPADVTDGAPKRGGRSSARPFPSRSS